MGHIHGRQGLIRPVSDPSLHPGYLNTPPPIEDLSSKLQYVMVSLVFIGPTSNNFMYAPPGGARINIKVNRDERIISIGHSLVGGGGGGGGVKN